jgi:hypothetical protein
MKTTTAAIVGILALVNGAVRADEFAAPLPSGVKSVWDLRKAYRETTPARERICINGLWRWQPAPSTAAGPPAGKWGYFKVPGCWPGITDYLQKDCQTVYAHPSWKDTRLASLTAAWYEREITVPGEWAGRRIALNAEYLNSFAAVYVGGKPAGEIRFPGGELDLTSVCRAGGTHTLSLLVVAMPLQAVMLSYKDTASARQVPGTVERRGLCGDVYLIGTPMDARIADVRVDTSVRKGNISFDVALIGLAPEERYTLHARIISDGRAVMEPASREFTIGGLEHGRFRFTESWKPDRLWDIHRPKNIYDLSLSLSNARGQVLDTTFDVRFGFRELWIDGRDFFMNGTRIFLSALPLDNAQVSAALASYKGARESLERLKGFGINFVYTHNYGCEPGSHLGFGEILRAADDVGMLVAISQPHFSHYQWRSPDVGETNGYRKHAEYYVRMAQNHPSVVFYAMSHNATGYDEDMNPDLIDGIHDPRDKWALNNSKLAQQAEAIVRRLDPSRIVYHHASGNLGSMHAINFYPNFAPIQELSDWFEHWALAGTKPAFTCEYGAPFTWDWAMYRGWYKGKRSFGSARVPWELCFAEWNAQFLGDRAYRISDMEKANLRWEARQFRAGSLWHRWDYPYELGSRLFDDRNSVLGMYLADNWRAFRTWGLSANSPWEHGNFWNLRAGVDHGRKTFPVDWDHLQRPGLSPDYLEERYERMDLAFERADWIPNAAGRALLRNNRPLLAYIGGKPSRFTSKDHIFRPGETVEKQIIVINNSREPVTCKYNWSFGDPLTHASGKNQLTVPTGQLERVPLRIPLRNTTRPGEYELTMSVAFNTGETQEDTFAIHVLPSAGGRTVTQQPANRSAWPVSRAIALFDTKGETRSLLDALGVPYRVVDAACDLSAHDMLIVGKSALTVDGPAPHLERVRQGLRVLIFEQSANVLEQRLGLRALEYGLRRVFPRTPDHPLLTGIAAEHLRDWRGAATILSPRLRYDLAPGHGPTVMWCDIPVARVWRCGNQGNVASVLIEKPTGGDFLPILDGGYGAQYSPLLEYREGLGLVLLCQLDVTGRTETDPAAETLARQMIAHVANWKSSPRRKAVYVGDPAGLRHLELAGISAGAFDGAKLSPDEILVVGPRGPQTLSSRRDELAGWLKAGGNLLAIGIDEQEANSFLPFQVRMQRAEHISAFFDPPGAGSLLAGIGPADVHNRDPRPLALLTSGATRVGNGILGFADGLNVVFCQLRPWEFDPRGPSNLRRTFRRTSFLVSRLLGNLKVASSTPILDRFATPVAASPSEPRWRSGLYLDLPEEWDFPYRFFRW